MLKQAGSFLLSALLLIPAMGYAEGKSGFYVGGHIGVAGVENTDTDVYSSYKINGSTYDTSSSLPFGNKRKTGLAGGISGGYDFSERYGTPVRLELNYTARSEAKSNKDREFNPGSANVMNLEQKTDMQTLMLNMWADLPTGTAFKPYVGGGIGVAFVDYNVNNTNNYYDGTKENFYSGSKSTTNFAWSLGAGVAYDVNPSFTLDLGYRYVNAGTVKVKSNTEPFTVSGEPANHVETETKVKSNELFLEGRYRF